MTQTPKQDHLSGVPAQEVTTATSLAPFATATLSALNDDTDVVTCYVLNDNPSAGVLDASGLPPRSCVAPAGGTLVMISGDPATVQTALRALRFQPAPIAAGSTKSAHLTVVTSNVADNVSSDRSMTGVVVQSVGVNVGLTGVPAAATVEDTQATVLLPKLVVVSAADDGVSVRVSMSDSSLGAFDTGGLAGLSVSATGNSDGSVTLAGSATAVSGALEALRFSPQALVSGATGREVFTIDATDTVNQTTASASVAWSIAGSHPAVSLAGVAAAAVIDGGGSATLFSSATMHALVSGDLTATVTLDSPGVGHFTLDRLPISDAGGVTGRLSQDGSVVTLAGRADAVQADLQALRFVSNNPANERESASVTLIVATTTSETASATEQLTITSSGSVPVLSGNATVTAAGDATPLYSGVTVSGPTTAVTATISLSDIATVGFNQAAFDRAETGNTAISYGYSADHSRLQIQGAAADVGKALRSVMVQPTTPAAVVQSRDVATLSLQADTGVASYATDILVAGPSLRAAAVTGIPSAATAAAGAVFLPFAQAGIVDPNKGDTVTMVVTASVSGLFAATSLAPGSSLSSDGSTVTMSGSGPAVQAALRLLAMDVPSSGAGSVDLAVQMVNSAGDARMLSGPVAETVTYQAPAYGSDTGSDNSGRVFMVSSDPSRNAVMDLSANQNRDIVVFGGKAALSLSAAHTTLVLNGTDQTGPVSLRSLGDDVVWVGAAPVDCVAGGHVRLILGAGTPASSTVTMHGGVTTDTNEFDVWGDDSELQTISTDGVSSATVFGGGARLDFTGGNATVILNGQGQTGAVAIHSLGGNTVWAGVAPLDLFEGAGNDTVLLTGAGSTTIHGATAGETGSTTVMSFGNTGAFTFNGGNTAAALHLGGGTNMVRGGTAAQVITMTGAGSLQVADDASASGAQQITMDAGSSASLQFLGGSNPATLVLGHGAATIAAGNHTTVTGGSGTASIDFSNAVGAVLNLDGSIMNTVDITGFDASRASVHLSHVVSSTIQNGSLVVAFTDGADATFHGYADPGHAGIGFG